MSEVRERSEGSTFAARIQAYTFRKSTCKKRIKICLKTESEIGVYAHGGSLV